MGDFENRKRGCIDSQESGGEKFSDRWGHRTWVKRYVGYVKKIGIRALKSKDIAFFANETPMLSPPGAVGLHKANSGCPDKGGAHDGSRWRKRC